MDCSTLADFRQQLYGCFGNARDALMNTCDALLTQTSARSFAELTLSPFFVRRWPSLYEAFDDAQIDQQALEKLFVQAARQATAGERLVLAADASPMVRAESPTARDRTYVHVPNLPNGARPTAPGWQFATVVALPQQQSSWTTILSNRRIKSQQTPGQVVAAQLRELTPWLPADALVAGDGAFGNVAFLKEVHDIPLGKLLRIAKNRSLYRAAPERSNRRGAPRKDGDPFVLSDPQTHGQPEHSWSGTDEQGQRLQVDCWHDLHFQQCRQVSLSLMRVSRQGAKGNKRDPKVVWLIWQGPKMPPLCQIPCLYRLRYCIEHSYRFDKQELLWTEPRLRTPEKLEHWTAIVSAAHNQITLARSMTDALRQPWASGKREPTPSQVRRACGRIVAQLGTPAALPQGRGKSPGRPLGAKIKKADRFQVLYKQPNKKKVLV